ncbi:MAG: hypothetical protein ACXW1U_01680 [Methylobacter sp.]
MMRKIWSSLLCVVMYSLHGTVCWAASADQSARNVGRDFSRPLARADLRWVYRNRRTGEEFDDANLRLGYFF